MNDLERGRRCGEVLVLKNNLEFISKEVFKHANSIDFCIDSIEKQISLGHTLTGEDLKIIEQNFDSIRWKIGYLMEISK